MRDLKKNAPQHGNHIAQNEECLVHENEVVLFLYGKWQPYGVGGLKVNKKRIEAQQDPEGSNSPAGHSVSKNQTTTTTRLEVLTLSGLHSLGQTTVSIC